MQLWLDTIVNADPPRSIINRKKSWLKIIVNVLEVKINRFDFRSDTNSDEQLYITPSNVK